MSLDLKSSELKHNFIKEHVSSVGKHCDEIKSRLFSYISKLASVTHSGDEVAQSISNYASQEIYNRTMRLSLKEFSDVLFYIERYREAQIQKTEVKVIQELESYNHMCKQTKVEIKKSFEAKNKELKKKNELEKARSKNPSNWLKITQAEREVLLAQENAQRMMQEMEKNLESFERKKLEGLKHIFLEFIKIQMIFHAKALEQYSKSFNILQEIQVEDDLQEFSSYLERAHTNKPAVSLARQSAASIVEDGDSRSPSHKTHTTTASTQRPQSSVSTLNTSADDINTSSGGALNPKFESVD